MWLTHCQAILTNMDRIDPNQLVVFHRVVRAGSFAEAGRQLGITRQSVSEQVARLERTLGVRLLERTTRSLRATDMGVRIAERSQAIDALVTDVAAEVEGSRESPTGTLRVSVPGMYGRLFLPAIAAELLARHPALRLEVDIGDRVVHLIDENFDAAVRIGRPVESSLVGRRLGEERQVFVASHALLAERGCPEPEELEAWPTIGIRAEERWQPGRREVVVRPRLVLGDLEAVRDAALLGLGIARLPRFSVRDAIEDDRLALVFPDAEPNSRDIWVVYPSRRFLPPKVRCFVDAVARHAEQVFGR